MIDNLKVISQIRELPPLTEADRKMLETTERRMGGAVCFVLRHEPESIGLQMDKQGWVRAEELIEKFNTHKKSHKYYLNLPVLAEMVRRDEKQRYGLKFQGETLMIRCCQGHSIPWLEMDYEVAVPPDILYHGTSSGSLEAILAEGLKPMERQKVHLSVDIPTAMKVGGRHRGGGSVVVLKVDTAAMTERGMIFYLADNDVWLTDYVPPEYLTY